MPPDLQPINDRLDKIDDKLDEVYNKLTALELKTCRRVDRNTLILNGILWFGGLVVTANVVAWVRYLW